MSIKKTIFSNKNNLLDNSINKYSLKLFEGFNFSNNTNKTKPMNPFEVNNKINNTITYMKNGHSNSSLTNNSMLIKKQKILDKNSRDRKTVVVKKFKSKEKEKFENNKNLNKHLTTSSSNYIAIHSQYNQINCNNPFEKNARKHFDSVRYKTNNKMKKNNVNVKSRNNLSDVPNDEISSDFNKAKNDNNLKLYIDLSNKGNKKENIKENQAENQAENKAENIIENITENITENINSLSKIANIKQSINNKTINIDNISNNLNMLNNESDTANIINTNTNINKNTYSNDTNPNDNITEKDKKLFLITEKTEQNADITFINNSDKDKTDKDKTDKDNNNKDNTDKDKIDKDNNNKDNTDKDKINKDNNDKDNTDKDKIDKDNNDKDKTDKDKTDKDKTDKNKTENLNKNNNNITVKFNNENEKEDSKKKIVNILKNKNLTKREKAFYILIKSPVLPLRSQLILSRGSNNIKKAISTKEILKNYEKQLKDKIKEYQKKIVEYNLKIKSHFRSSKIAEISLNFITNRCESQFCEIYYKLLSKKENSTTYSYYQAYIKVIYYIIDERIGEVVNKEGNMEIDYEKILVNLFDILKRKGYYTIKDYLYYLFISKTNKRKERCFMKNMDKIDELISKEEPKLLDLGELPRMCKFIQFSFYLVKEIIEFGKLIKETTRIKIETENLLVLLKKNLYKFRNKNNV